MAAQNQKADPKVLNLMSRQALLDTATPFKKIVTSGGPYSLGQTAVITLDRMGIFTMLEVQVSASITVANAAATASPFGPYALVQNIKYTDFNSVDRVNTNGPQLYQLGCLRNGWIQQGATTQTNAVANAAYTGVGSVDTNQTKLPTAVGSDTINFTLWVPLAYDQTSDLRGAVLAQTVVGDHFLKIKFADVAGSATDVLAGPYNSTAANLSLTNINLTVYEHYLQPQNLNMLPIIDLGTIYGIEGNYVSTANLQSNTPFYINYPNNRSIVSAISIFENNGAVTLNGTDIVTAELIANANTQIRQETPSSLRRWVRNTIGGDLPSGTYVFNSRKNPISTYLYGNVQAKFNMGTVNSGSGPTQFVTQFEDFYPAGVPLPGIASGY